MHVTPPRGGRYPVCVTPPPPPMWVWPPTWRSAAVEPPSVLGPALTLALPHADASQSAVAGVSLPPAHGSTSLAVGEGAGESAESPRTARLFDPKATEPNNSTIPQSMATSLIDR